MSAAQMDPHDKMRSRDLSKVAKGEQAPRPVHQPGTVSRPPPPSSTDSNLAAREKGSSKNANGDIGDRMRHCYTHFLDYKRCIEEKGKDHDVCQKIGREFTSSCPSEWIEKWHEERDQHGR